MTKIPANTIIAFSLETCSKKEGCLLVVTFLSAQALLALAPWCCEHKHALRWHMITSPIPGERQSAAKPPGKPQGLAAVQQRSRLPISLGALLHCLGSVEMFALCSSSPGKAQLVLAGIIHISTYQKTSTAEMPWPAKSPPSTVKG